MNVLLRLAVYQVLVLSFCWSLSAADGFSARGFYTHDPSTIVKEKNDYWVFSTGRGIRSRHSKDLVEWQNGPVVFESAPEWTTNRVPGFKGFFWAPDVIRVQDRYLLFYSVSTWGSRTSAIGLATNVTLDPGDPRCRWTDCGPVVESSPRDDFNAIDPSVMQDSEGRLWLAFGSFWSGIKLVELEPTSGRRLHPDSDPITLAWKEAIEAPCLHQHGGEFYLFVNWGLCCRGTNSTYSIRVGRCPNILGPYLDKDGMDLRRGGGSLVLETEGRFVGPGHAGILRCDGTNWFSYHYYDGANNGRATLGVRELQWDAEGWPKLVEPMGRQPGSAKGPK